MKIGQVKYYTGPMTLEAIKVQFSYLLLGQNLWTSGPYIIHYSKQNSPDQTDRKVPKLFACNWLPVHN